MIQYSNNNLHLNINDKKRQRDIIITSEKIILIYDYLTHA